MLMKMNIDESSFWEERRESARCGQEMLGLIQSKSSDAPHIGRYILDQFYSRVKREKRNKKL